MKANIRFRGISNHSKTVERSDLSQLSLTILGWCGWKKLTSLSPKSFVIAKYAITTKVKCSLSVFSYSSYLWCISKWFFAGLCPSGFVRKSFLLLVAIDLSFSKLLTTFNQLASHEIGYLWMPMKLGLTVSYALGSSYLIYLTEHIILL